MFKYMKHSTVIEMYDTLFETIFEQNAVSYKIRNLVAENVGTFSMIVTFDNLIRDELLNENV